MFLFWIRLYFHLSPSLPGPFVLWCFSSVKSYKSLHNAIELLMLYRHQDHLSLFTAHWRKMPYSAKWAGSVRYSEYIYIQRRHEQAHTPTHTHTHTHIEKFPQMHTSTKIKPLSTTATHTHTHTHTHTLPIISNMFGCTNARVFCIAATMVFRGSSPWSP